MENLIPLLIIEDSEYDALLVLHELEESGLLVEARRVTTENELQKALTEREWKIVLGDFSLRGFSGMKALAMVHAHDPDLPFIMVSGIKGEESAVEAMRAGARDFITKDNLTRLSLAFRRELASREERRARRKAEAEREQREREFRQLANSMPQLVWTATPDGRVDYYNRQREEFSGFLQANGGHWVWAPVLYPDDLEPTQRCWEEALRTGNTYQIAHRVMRIDGSFRWYLSRATPVRNSKGEIVKWYGTATDIDDLKKVEAEREQLLAELDATIHSMANAVLTYDNRGRIRRMNPAAEEMLRYSHEMKDWPILKRKATLRPETPDGDPYPLEGHPTVRALKGETTLSEVMVYHPPGATQPLWAAVSASPIRTPHGDILGAVSTVTDISALHELQKEREIYVHTIFHDLRTPLTVVLGHVQLLEQTCQDEKSHLHFDAIHRGVDYMTRMIENLVEVARLEGGKIFLDKRGIRINHFLPELLYQASAALDVSRIFLHIPDNLPPVNADPHRLERIFINLLTNALKYSPAKGRVDIVAKLQGEEVMISVRDCGQGINHEDLPHIFKRFHRIPERRQPVSVGLGLYITQSLVEAHGGRIWVESTPGAGATFSFTLPVESKDSRDVSSPGCKA